MARSSLPASALLLIALFSITDSLSATGVSEDTDSEPANTLTVRTAVGETAFLTCHLADTGNHDVSWARQQPDNVMLVHQRRFSVRVGRLQASCSKHNDDCLLMIRNVQKSDSGLYLCMVDCEPPIRRSVYLSVFVPAPVATILGEPLRALWQGSAVNLTCVVQPPPGPGEAVVWMRGGSIIHPFLDSRITIITEVDTSTRSHLLIEDAQPKDSGTYTCQLTSGSRDSVDVDVMQVVRDDFSPMMSGTPRPLPAVLVVLASTAAAAAAARRCC